MVVTSNQPWRDGCILDSVTGLMSTLFISPGCLGHFGIPGSFSELIPLLLHTPLKDKIGLSFL